MILMGKYIRQIWVNVFAVLKGSQFYFFFTMLKSSLLPIPALGLLLRLTEMVLWTINQPYPFLCTFCKMTGRPKDIYILKKLK